MSVAEYFSSMEYGPASEDDQPARAWLAQHDARFGHFIGGAWHAPASGARFVSHAPASGERLAEIAQGDAADIDAAVAAARAAQPGWAALGGAARARHLYALARMVQRHSRLFAVLEALDNGKPIRETRDIDVPLVARHLLHHAGWAQLQDSEFADYAPLGVIGQIVPWNFPLLMLAWKIAPAIATGNCVVLKPAEYTPLTALLFAELAHRAGLPAGVLNVVTGDGTTGAALVEHLQVDKIAFTGSTEVGKQIRSVTAGSGKSLTLELGGKSPFIVFDDADLDAAVEGVVDAIWFNQGQVCCAGSRLLVQEGVEARFIAKLKRRMASLRVGASLDKNIDMGAVVDAVQLERIRSLVESGRREGCTIWQAEECALPADGCFYPPTLVTNVAPASILAQQEIFGPVLVTMSFRTPDEAIALANNSRYGLAASVWSETIGRALDVAPRLASGVVWINATNLFDAAVGFGGYRESGYGREGGREGIYEYLKPRAWLNLPKRRTVDATQQTSQRTHFEHDAPNIVSIDRTAKLFIGGKQVRPDSGYSLTVHAPDGTPVGEVGAGNRKDIRNAVEAARAAHKWSQASAHNRAQVLFYLAENLAVRADEFAQRLCVRNGVAPEAARAEVEASVTRLFAYAAWADKFDGAVHTPPLRGVALAMHEPLGVIGIACPDEAPLLAFVSLAAPALAMGNRVVVLPGEAGALTATDFYQVVETSDVPGGVLNIVTGARAGLLPALASHDDVDALWCFGNAADSALVERLSVGNLKRTFTDYGKQFDWFGRASEGRPFLREAVQVKNIWIPYGD
ncbi:aldehyde dehydrogenase family protein [bacterium M00.F.Ca.ET.228.01.1.1]|uniref:aldehyde dehydrogenase family protein n=1 Tax=Paraburkholderia phenoliruptrix TaxID=252970 RepID=UPI001092EC0A|nr:aldehyde dehydrogenase family protein [Paraburkholderia phenoliruptrix]TGP39992.1 aldehyde dehydrogenase family protein [bacterium M00.F.Ca.ET.228.01.1.1]TGR95926.1 aldehyde dehydrogenase family protein [bacterium M00.F.Ca.ET.191.01.1.1]TGT97031.1 aldehyde dehydrogenase family protein [bacterium M00.F.Ca.ET.155.01.1.1]MBW0448698.1 aldehyde dehydrogenase family protein [Paraburkholderia phenoliruptrix]MBW9100440.1 aldehyde dehydrogenase family protein [Paraburkholderia phenoliruptrix]